MRKWKICLGLVMLLGASAYGQININTATADELALLKGIGASRAQAIVSYREAHGNFAAVEELAQVKGIGKKTVEKLAQDLRTQGKTDLSQLQNRAKGKSRATSGQAKGTVSQAVEKENAGQQAAAAKTSTGENGKKASKQPANEEKAGRPAVVGEGSRPAAGK